LSFWGLDPLSLFRIWKNDVLQTIAMHPDNNLDSVLAWQTPFFWIYVMINISVKDGNILCGNGVAALLLHNQFVLTKQAISNGNSTGFQQSFQMSVLKGVLSVATCCIGNMWCINDFLSTERTTTPCNPP
jgi:hypothetical protein